VTRAASPAAARKSRRGRWCAGGLLQFGLDLREEADLWARQGALLLALN